MPAPLNNKNAQRETPKDGLLTGRVKREDKGRWSAAAEQWPTKQLIPWVINALNTWAAIDQSILQNWEKSAQQEGLSLADWLIKQVNRPL